MTSPLPDKDLEILGRRIDEARRKAGLEESKPPRSSMSNGAQAGMELVVAVLAFAFLGLWLDRTLGSEPLFMLLGLCLGFAVGFWNLYRLSKGAGPFAIGIKKKDE